MQHLQKRLYEILNVTRPDDRAGHSFELFITTLILANVVALVIETMEPVRELAGPLFDAFETFSLAIFTVEYTLRLWSCTVSSDYAHPVRGRLRFARTPFAIVDLLAIAPAFLPFISADLRVMRSLRLFRLLRLAKLARYMKTLQLIGRVVCAKREELLLTLSVLALLLLLASSLIYFAEHGAQSEAFSSIPASMWWAVTTITTVGYGDLIPVTVPGRLLAAIIAILGIGMFALPTSILGAGFLEELQKKKEVPGLCPHCGKALPHP
ncbi:MAG: potassium channel family protein [Planctomycetota bacterium]